jgi:hypothetical protein
MWGRHPCPGVVAASGSRRARQPVAWWGLQVDLEEADGLFHDAKASARLLAEQADKYIS